LEFRCEYDFDINHIKGKENKVHKLHATTISMYQNDIKRIIFEAGNPALQYKDLVEKILQGEIPLKVKNYKLETDGTLLYKNIIDVPNVHDLKLMILNEMHNVPYVGPPRYQKTMATIKSHYFFPSIKKEIVEYIARCMECQKVKSEHRHPTGLLQPLPILEWMWEVVTMDFITRLPRTRKEHDSVMVVVHKLTKDAHFIPLKTNHKTTNVADIFMSEIT
jgi:hypothetical protein